MAQNLFKLRTKRPIPCLGNAFSVDVMNHAGERKSSLDARFAIYLETKGISQHSRDSNAKQRSIYSERNKSTLSN